MSIRKSINLFPTVKVTWGSCAEIRIGCLKSKGVPWPFTGYQCKGNCSAAEVAPSPNWVPCRVLDGDTKPGPCAPGVNIETSIRSPWVGETGGSERSDYVGGMEGQLEQLLVQPAQPVGELDMPEGGLNLEVTCPHSHFLPLPLVEQVPPWFSFQTTAP